MTADTDRLVSFLLPGRDVRGRLLRLGAVLDEVLAAHPYGETAARLLAEALTLVALVGAILKPDEGQVTLQAQPAQGRHGPVRLLVADHAGGALRGYIELDPDLRLPADGDLAALFGQGRLVITIDQATTARRYQGVVPLEGRSLAETAESYFRQSEQIPTLVRLAASRDPDGRWRSGGILLQHLPRGEEGGARLHAAETAPNWAHVEALARTLTDGELLDAALPLEQLLGRLFAEDEVRLFSPVALTRGCRCSEDYIRAVLMRFPAAERAAMRDADGVIWVDCRFCSRRFRFDL
ncbi:MAG: Hsp33 family molecular chaperone HslO [Sphingomonadaceae bacterium]|uniref:Hsp33 family molecular chaperone HslO n=1 Tax=Thermaurantiacus sp. TaxID=2820283 RepID=UPI00298F2CA7|nr:Hsp33 family molecular chaperone HslO [Thermaurantiacus sp.]MCS6986870.1 Hsp33 family molecular chaperone HslO [Sphingomonadaceae bacterium]MDW8415530.1 Hsp33 family molecular chaperone HslO [Thermaurantiacus sp.]